MIFSSKQGSSADERLNTTFSVACDTARPTALLLSDTQLLGRLLVLFFFPYSLGIWFSPSLSEEIDCIKASHRLEKIDPILGLGGKGGGVTQFVVCDSLC